MHQTISDLLILISDSFENRTVHTHKKYLEKTQWLSRKDLEKLQLKKFKALLVHAYSRVPHYHECFKEAGFHPADFMTFADAERIPILDRSTVRTNCHSMLQVGNPSSRDIVNWTTSGTTAAPVEFCRGKTDLSWAVAAELRGYGWAGYRVGDRVGLVWAYGADRTRHFKFKLEKSLTRMQLLNVYTMSEDSMNKFATKLYTSRPSFIRGYSGALNIFATYLLCNPQFKITPRAVFTSASTLLPNYRKTIERAFNAKVYDYYGSNEVSHIAAQCGQHPGLHITEENIYLEIVNDKGQSVSPGEEGRILVTNLNSYDMPFIRYDIGDLGKILNDTCSCGRKLALLKPIGRTYEYFVNRDGSFTCLKDFETVFEGLPISEFQVVQKSFEEIVVRIVPVEGFTQANSEFIRKNIRFRGSAQINIELVNSIPPENSGKVQHVVSELRSTHS